MNAATKVIGKKFLCFIHMQCDPSVIFSHYNAALMSSLVGMQPTSGVKHE